MNLIKKNLFLNFISYLYIIVLCINKFIFKYKMGNSYCFTSLEKGEKLVLQSELMFEDKENLEIIKEKSNKTINTSSSKNVDNIDKGLINPLPEFVIVKRKNKNKF
jgi:hypothetical protein